MNEKPMELERQELIEGIAGLINNAKLPAFVVADIFKMFLPELERAAAQQYEQAKQAYEKEHDKKK